MARDETWGVWRYGDVAIRREALKGHPWTAFATYVVVDTPELLVTYLAPGSTLGFPAWPLERWQHPWQVAGHEAWSGHGKLMMQRPGEAYSVDVFWRGEPREFAGWYLNLQEPLVRDATGYDTLDHELDFWLPAAGGWEVKDAELFEERVAEERYTPAQAEGIRRTGREIEAMLVAGDTWWDRGWAEWSPPPEWGPLPVTV
ncbi:DUF402 domain-containing protein [Nocardioides mesophilus]|uniref:DUF402 domain-containing protein n=1 Tax=Nocardioides mesophilus TaxID=433659 RepID=A0A7G9RA35_9ACTN|nr:DUF402 domain-containing protein [Nocardioides mesophilus]QNN52460.1 DUF402 domain-containing protein [Nocardioides mesophilus]